MPTFMASVVERYNTTAADYHPSQHVKKIPYLHFVLVTVLLLP